MGSQRWDQSQSQRHKPLWHLHKSLAIVTRASHLPPIPPFYHHSHQAAAARRAELPDFAPSQCTFIKTIIDSTRTLPQSSILCLPYNTSCSRFQTTTLFFNNPTPPSGHEHLPRASYPHQTCGFCLAFRSRSDGRWRGMRGVCWNKFYQRNHVPAFLLFSVT